MAKKLVNYIRQFLKEDHIIYHKLVISQVLATTCKAFLRKKRITLTIYLKLFTINKETSRLLYIAMAMLARN